MASSSFTWLRLHHEARNDAKLRSLDDRQFRVWFNLLCFSGEQSTRGVIQGIELDLLAVEIASGDTDLLSGTLDRLERIRIIGRDGDTITFLNFNKRQYDKPSDAPQRVASRVSEHRKRQRNATETPERDDETRSNADVTRCNALDTDTETEAETEAETEGLRPPEGPPTPPAEPPADAPKRRDEKAKPRTRIGVEFTPTQALMAWAKNELLVDDAWIRSETEKFRDYWAAEGKPKADWAAAWKVWMRKSLDYRPRGRASPGPAMTGTPSGWDGVDDTPEGRQQFAAAWGLAGTEP